MDGSFLDLFFRGQGPFGITDEFLLNLGAELIGLVLSVILITIGLDAYRTWRENRRWKASRLRIAEGIEERHHALTEALSHGLQTILDGSPRFGPALPDRMSQQLESTTRYYERNVTFLPPASLHHFEDYRATLKAFVGDLHTLLPIVEHSRPFVESARKSLKAFDFGQLEKHAVQFQKSLGYGSARIDKKKASGINGLMGSVLDLPAEALSASAG